ncbi:hypothetical protein [uncultured Oceanicoccus sp.]
MEGTPTNALQLFCPDPGHHMALAVENNQQDLIIRQFDKVDLV